MRLITIFFFVSILTLSTFQASAQSTDETFCTELVRKLPNDQTERIRLTNKSEIRINDLVSGDLYQVAFLREPAKYTLVLKALKDVCFDAKTPVTLFFRNGTKIELLSTNKDNCESLITVDLGKAGKDNKIQNHLLDQYLIGIQYTGFKKDTIKLKVGTPQNEMIQELFECISK